MNNVDGKTTVLRKMQDALRNTKENTACTCTAPTHSSIIEHYRVQCV